MKCALEKLHYLLGRRSTLVTDHFLLHWRVKTKRQTAAQLVGS